MTCRLSSRTSILNRTSLKNVYMASPLYRSGSIDNLRKKSKSVNYSLKMQYTKFTNALRLIVQSATYLYQAGLYDSVASLSTGFALTITSSCAAHVNFICMMTSLVYFHHGFHEIYIPLLTRMPRLKRLITRR